MINDEELSGREIVCVGFADWDSELWTNQQHLMSRLARRNRVLFIESLGLRQPQLSSRDVKRVLARLRRGVAPPTHSHGVDVLSPLVLPLHRYRCVRWLNAWLLPLLVRRATRKLGFAANPILWAYVPQAEVLLDALAPALVVYHCVDDMAAQPGIDAESFRAAEERFAVRADLVLTSAPELATRLRQVAGRVVEAPNVADTELFATALSEGPVDPALAELATPRIVFTGAVVSTKLDFELIVELARLRPEWSFAIVGPVGPGAPTTDASMLGAEPNVHLLGPRAYVELPALLRGAQAGLIPYARNALTRSVFPMKVYEYLAAGLPVVSTRLPALGGVEDVSCGDDAPALVELLSQALATDSPQLAVARSGRAAMHSWDARLREIAIAISQL